MSFSNAVFWILAVYAVYYSVIFITDAFYKRSKNEVSAVQVIHVPKPADQPILVDYADYMPKQASAEEPMEDDITDDNQGGQGNLVEKKKLAQPQKMYDLDNIKADIPVSGQPVEVNFCINQFLEATKEETELRQSLRSVGNLIY